MTTNRAGSLDEAFKSRIHYKIYYPPLTITQTLEIWQINLQRLHKIEEEEQRQWNQAQTNRSSTRINANYTYNPSIPFPKAPHKPMDIPDEEILRFAHHEFGTNRPGTTGWNGRQIRNAFQAAKCLAYAEAAAKAERDEEALALASQSGSIVETDRVVIPAPRLQVKHFEEVHKLEKEFNKYMEEVFSGMDDAQLAREKEERADHFLQPTPVKFRPGSGTGWKQHSSHSHLSRYEEETTCFESTVSMSRPHSRGAAGGVGMTVGGGGHGAVIPPRSPRVSNDWLNGPSLIVPFGGGSGPSPELGGIRAGITLQQQQQRQFQEPQSGMTPPLLQPTMQASGGRYYPDQNVGRGPGEETGTRMLDNGPLPQQIAHQGRIGNPPRTMGQEEFYYNRSGGNVGGEEGNYTFTNGMGVRFLHGNDSQASRAVSPGVSLSPTTHHSSLSGTGGGMISSSNKVPRGIASREGSDSVTLGTDGDDEDERRGKRLRLQ